jgi:hypothetical protein
MKKPTENAPKKIPRELNPGQKFLRSLTYGPEFHLKLIAKALYDATGARQEALHQHLCRGDLVASVYWPTPSDVADLPPSIWRDVALGKFQVRSMHAGRWRFSNYALPSSLLTKHLVAPLLRSYQSLIDPGPAGPTAPPAEFPAPGRTLHGTASIEHLLAKALYMLETGTPEASVVVTAPHARAFADNFLGSVTERRGRRKIPDAELLQAEIFRRLHLLLSDDFPLQKLFIHEMELWWSSSPDRVEVSKDWIEKYVKSAYATLRKAPNS